MRMMTRELVIRYTRKMNVLEVILPLLKRRDDYSIPTDELYVQFNASMFINNNPSIEEHNANFDNEEELSSNYDTEFEHTEL
jgi:hypothetical protein